MRKIYSLSMVKDEAAIIESFIRYNINFLDCMIIIDNGCTDGTMEIIRNLKNEGLNIICYSEAAITYDQYIIENKYMYKIIEEYNPDMIIPLDADEFLDADIKLNDVLQQIPLDRVYYLKWRTYIVTHNDNNDEPFVPARIKHYRMDGNELGENDTRKVLIPAQLIAKYNIILNTGHHSVMYKEGLLIEKIDSLRIAHFPAINLEQYKSSIYSICINYITCMNRGETDGRHKFRMFHRLMNDTSDLNIELISSTYGFSDVFSEKFNVNEDVIYKPIDISQCTNIDIKYKDLAKVDLFKNILNFAQILAIRNYNLERDLKERKGRPKLLVYGTGSRARNIFYGLNKNDFDIRAYIDSDKKKEYMLFEERIIISPEKIKFFPFDKIIIASSYYNEIYDILVKQGITSDLIEDKSWLIKLSI